MVDDFRQRYRLLDDSMDPFIGDPEDIWDIYEFVEGVWETYFVADNAESSESENESMEGYVGGILTESVYRQVERLMVDCRSIRERETQSVGFPVPDVRPLLAAQEFIFRVILEADYPNFLKSTQFAQGTVAIVYSQGGTINIPKNGRGGPRPVKKSEQIQKSMEKMTANEEDRRKSVDYSVVDSHNEFEAGGFGTSALGVGTGPKKFPFMETVFRHRKPSKSDRKKRTISYYVSGSRSGATKTSTTTHLPVRTDQNDSETIEEELQAIILSEENAFPPQSYWNPRANNNNLNDVDRTYNDKGDDKNSFDSALRPKGSLPRVRRFSSSKLKTRFLKYSNKSSDKRDSESSPDSYQYDSASPQTGSTDPSPVVSPASKLTIHTKSFNVDHGNIADNFLTSSEEDQSNPAPLLNQIIALDAQIEKIRQEMGILEGAGKAPLEAELKDLRERRRRLQNEEADHMVVTVRLFICSPLSFPV